MMGIGLPELLLILIIFVGGGLWIWMIVDCAKNEPAETNKVVWILVILLGGCIGAAIYLIVRRPMRQKQFGR